MVESSKHKISAGSHDLNKWLSGGYEKDIISTIYGPAGSGKSNFCILASASQAKQGMKVIFIDIKAHFTKPFLVFIYIFILFKIIIVKINFNLPA